MGKVQFVYSYYLCLWIVSYAHNIVDLYIHFLL